MRDYDVTVTREGKWWMVAIPDLDGLTQARRPTEIAEMARDYIALTLNVVPSEVGVRVHYKRVGPVEDVERRLQDINDSRQEARDLERKATNDATALARQLVAAEVPLREVGEVLGLSHQRVHQLVNAGHAE